MIDKPTQLELTSRYLDGTATPEETQALEALILNDPVVRREFLRYTYLDAALVRIHSPQMQTVLANPLTQTAKLTARTNGKKPFVRLSKRPLTAATLGLIIGLLSASVVWAHVAQIGKEISTLLIEDFESPSLEIVSNVPLENGIWRGDRAVVVGEEQGVKPASGLKMLRFLHEGFEGRARQRSNHIADVYRLIDVRRFQHNIAGDRSVVQASASMNSIPFPPDEKYGCSISVYALDADAVPESATKIGTALTQDSTAMARSIRTKLDADASQWQHLTTELQLPSNTAFLVIRLHITQAFDGNGMSPFTGTYVDDISVSLRRRVPLL